VSFPLWVRRSHKLMRRKRKIRINRAARASALESESTSSPPEIRPSSNDLPAYITQSASDQPEYADPFLDGGTSLPDPGWDELEMIGSATIQDMPLSGTSATSHQDNFAASAYGGNNYEEVWNLIFGQQQQQQTSQPSAPAPTSSQAHIQSQYVQPFDPSYTSDDGLMTFFTSPSPPRPISSMPGVSISTAVPDLTYLHHYLNVVLPLQYRFVVKSFADLVAPLALSNPEILKSTSALAALHMASQKGRGHAKLPWGDEPDTERNFAMISHKETINRLRFISPAELTSEGVVLPALFALSYYLFSGGTARDWTEALAVSRRCLSAAFTASPEITGEVGSIVAGSLNMGHGAKSPWKRYRPLMCAMVWMDIVGSVSQNKSTRLLPIYRQVLSQPAAGWNGMGEGIRAKLHMERVVGCDDTTVSFQRLSREISIERSVLNHARKVLTIVPRFGRDGRLVGMARRSGRRRVSIVKGTSASSGRYREDIGRTKLARECHSQPRPELGRRCGGVDARDV